MINWRSVLSELRVEWWDRGPNRSIGSISIRCPWCGNADPSHHLSIDESTGAYYCFRRPRDHYGRSAAFLLKALGASASLVDQLVKRREKPRNMEKSAASSLNSVFVNWDRFAPAAENIKMRAYLEERGFDDAARVAQKFDLRYAGYGKWADRLLIPLRENGQVRGFTGRAIRPNLEPKYKMHAPGHLMYVPAIPDFAQALVVVEGPMDALKIAYACPYLLPVALTGLALSPLRIHRIVEMAERISSVLFVLDNDQPRSVVYSMIDELEAALRRKVQRVSVPGNAKDPGELELKDIRLWMHAVQSTIPNGRAFSKTGLAALSG